jgi:DNA-binding transcriptional LysR family regulator
MAGKMMGAKGMGANRKAPKTPSKAEAPKPSAPKAPSPKIPRSAHIREAEGGYILSKHGGDEDGIGFPKDHVAPDFDAAMAMARAHLGVGATPVVTAAPDQGGAKKDVVLKDKNPPA